MNKTLEGYEYLVNGFLEVFDKQLNIPKRPITEEVPEINIVSEGYKQKYPEISNKISKVLWSKGAG